MDHEAIAAWVSNQAACSDPNELQLPLQHFISASSTSYPPPAVDAPTFSTTFIPQRNDDESLSPRSILTPAARCQIPASLACGEVRGGRVSSSQAVKNCSHPLMPRPVESYKDQIYKLRHSRLECFRSSSLHSGRSHCPSALRFAHATWCLPRTYEYEAPALTAVLVPQAPLRILMTFLNSKSP